MKLSVFYLANVLAVAFPLALLEIWLEKYKTGWNGEFRNQFWGHKIYNKFICVIFQKTYVSVYHVIMFAGVIPAIYLVEYLLLRERATEHGWIITVWSVRFIPALYFPALWLGVATLEDFLWFALNWRFPHALRRLTSGEMTWHTKWIKITPSVKVPDFYLTVPILIIVLFFIQFLICRLVS